MNKYEALRESEFQIKEFKKLGNPRRGLKVRTFLELACPEVVIAFRALILIFDLLNEYQHLHTLTSSGLYYVYTRTYKQA